MNSEVKFLEPCKAGPIVKDGLMTTISNPFSSTKFHASFSASVLDNWYQSYNKHIIKKN